MKARCEEISVALRRCSRADGQPADGAKRDFGDRHLDQRAAISMRFGALPASMTRANVVLSSAKAMINGKWAPCSLTEYDNRSPIELPGGPFLRTTPAILPPEQPLKAAAASASQPAKAW